MSSVSPLDLNILPVVDDVSYTSEQQVLENHF